MYWTEPEKNQWIWTTTKFSKDGEKLGYREFGSEKQCWDFLKTINIYIDGVKCYSGL